MRDKQTTVKMMKRRRRSRASLITSSPPRRRSKKDAMTCDGSKEGGDGQSQMLTLGKNLLSERLICEKLRQLFQRAARATLEAGWDLI